jgi:tetratricopeptide (TPR) repeat protein
MGVFQERVGRSDDRALQGRVKLTQRLVQPRFVSFFLVFGLAWLPSGCQSSLCGSERDRAWAEAERASLRGDWTSAVSLWNEIRLEDQQGGARPSAETARAMLALGKTDEALALIERASARYPDAAELHALRADVLDRLGFQRAAEAELLAATRLDPESAYYWERLAEIQLGLACPLSAAASLERARTNGSASPSLPLLQARAARSAGSGEGFARAHLHYRWAIDQRLSQPESASAPLHTPGLQPGALAKNPTACELLVEAASLYAALDSPRPAPAQLEACLEWSERAAALDPQFVCAHFVHGLLLERAQRPEEALVSYRRAVEVDGHHLGATTNLALLCHRLGRFAEAGLLFERAMALESDAERRAKLAELRAASERQATG